MRLGTTTRPARSIDTCMVEAYHNNGSRVVEREMLAPEILRHENKKKHKRPKTLTARSLAAPPRELQRFEVDQVLGAAGGALHRDQVVDRGDGDREAVEVHAVCPALECRVAR